MNAPVSPRPATTSHIGLAAVCAGLMAAIGWLALAIECDFSLSGSFARGRSLLAALFFYAHFFTIITNVGIAVLMSVSLVRLLARRPLPPARLYNAALIYILVTCVTYEIMLRGKLKPHGLQFFTDATIHDFVPALMLVFWIAFAPREGVRWRDALWMLAYPAAYLAMTLVAGALGAGYPYSFLDVDKLGYGGVLVSAVVFLTAFYGLGLITTGLAMRFGAPSSRAKGDATQGPQTAAQLDGDR